MGFEESGEYDKEAKHEKVKRAHDLGSSDFLSIFSNFVPAVVSSSTLSNFIPTEMTQGSRAAGEGEEST